MNGLTLSEISERLDIPVNTLRQRMTRLGIKPLTKEAVYSESVLPQMDSVKMGRPPKKVEAPEAGKENQP